MRVLEIEPIIDCHVIDAHRVECPNDDVHRVKELIDDTQQNDEYVTTLIVHQLS